MNISAALFLILIAGIINGSFALPTKHIPKWKFENIWLQFALWAFIILPWLLALILVPQIFNIYAKASNNILLAMVIGGFIFGIGQMCFALALNMIGLGLGFVINLGLGITLGFLLPLLTQHPDQLLQPFGLTTLLGCILAVCGLVMSHRAGNIHQREQRELRDSTDAKKSTYTLGVILAVLAGLSSAGQNFAFSLTAPMQQLAIDQGAGTFGAANIMWPGFLACGFIPYALYMIALMFKNKSFKNFTTVGTKKYYLFAVIMGLFWYGSLIFYSKATQLIGTLGSLVGWPLFMVLIILASNFWGWRSGEWTGSSTKTKHAIWLGLGFLLLSVLVFGYSSSLHS